MCIDYRQLNKYTRKNEFLAPNADMLLDMLSGAFVNSARNPALGYHRLRINPTDIFNTVYKTQFSQFEWLVVPFGLTSAPSSYQRLMNHILHPHKNTFILVYFDDICFLAIPLTTIFDTLTLLSPSLPHMTFASASKNGFLLVTNSNTSDIWLAKRANVLPIVG
jgi:hypothetical protein